MAGQEDYPDYNTKMYIKSEWTPRQFQIPYEIQTRLNEFKQALKKLVKPQKAAVNLLRHQKRSLNQQRNQTDFLIVQCDKNLGPAIIKRLEYIMMAFRDHLNCRQTYKHLTPFQTAFAKGQLLMAFQDWIKRNKNVITNNETKYFKRHIAKNTDPFGVFYLLMKVHKMPLSSRGIISGSGSLLHALGTWVYAKLQCFAHRLPDYFKSSYELKKMLTSITIPPNTFLFTADAVSVYTNIPMTKALSFISNHIRETAHEFQDIPVEALVEALGIVMRNNVFTFGDVTYRQVRGTVMGTPPAPIWANLYMSINEDTFLQPVHTNLTFYKRFIDYVLGLWTIIKTATNAVTWAAFGLHLNAELFELEWIIQPLSAQVDLWI
jgi:hypothetical protein